MIQAIAFDLDDTLLDTSRLLLGAAALHACEAMVAKGLPCTVEQCLDWRAELAANLSHKEVFPEIARRTSAPDHAAIGAAGVQTFYNAPIPPRLPLMDDAEDVLARTEKKYSLYLVTSGAPDTQWEKIRATGIEKRFKGIFVVDKMKNAHKKTAFLEILRKENIPAEKLLSVGNRLAEEIRLAKQLGAWTCHFEYGEHAGEQKFFPEDHPDFTVHSWREFLATCRL